MLPNDRWGFAVEVIKGCYISLQTTAIPHLTVNMRSLSSVTKLRAALILFYKHLNHNAGDQERTCRIRGPLLAGV